MHDVTPKKSARSAAREENCPRPYTLGKRQQFSDEARERAIEAAAAMLADSSFVALRMEDVAAQAGITRQTLYNLFGSKTLLIEAVFDHIARVGGMESMRSAMMQADAEKRLAAMVEVFAGFWTASRIVTRHIRAMAATDAELHAAIHARDERRRMACQHVVRGFAQFETGKDGSVPAPDVLWALTSFEFFDLLAGEAKTPQEAAETVLRLARAALGLSAL